MNSPEKKYAIIIGAGPAGLTAAYELLHRSDITPIIFEKSNDIGGISKTVNYKGNRIDIGGHRFFSKSDKVMDWWLHIMPLDPTAQENLKISYQNKTREVHPLKTSVEHNENVMLVRKRVSHIFYLKKFFSYPVSLSIDTMRKLGLARMINITMSYLRSKLFPIRDEKTLEDFFINRFGNTLYKTFFRDYTEKVWGVPCKKIPATWGAQRIKELSISKAIWHALTKHRKQKSITQKDTTTSLIENFLYPKYGPGQLWEEVARIIQEKGGIIRKNSTVSRFKTNPQQEITAVEIQINDKIETYTGDYFISTMPVKELIAGFDREIPRNVIETAEGLQYRDFITVGLLVKKLIPPKGTTTIEDTWIYIQEKDVQVGRLQIFNNWSPHMVKDSATYWIGLEYFCNTGDELWSKPDTDIMQIGISELEKIGLILKEDVLDKTVIRMEKAYPAYFGTYTGFDKIREFTDGIPNLFLVGRNGMHKYNNTDHSMLTAMAAVDNIIAGSLDKSNIWAINTEQDYHEESKAE